ncbi:MAG: class I SAM-dependent methyltransferase [Thermoanaerobaculia bacterium]
MTTRRLEDWNARYRSREEIQSEPAPLLVRAAESLAPGRALDLACGAGRNALYLARLGWQVVAIDGASEAIRILQERTSTLPVDARVVDLENGAALPFDDESFDLVAILFYLHRPLFAEARRVVKHGGVIVAAALMSGTFRIAPGELAGTFSDFEIVHAGEGEIAEIVARKPVECGGNASAF